MNSDVSKYLVTTADMHAFSDELKEVDGLEMQDSKDISVSLNMIAWIIAFCCSTISSSCREDVLEVFKFEGWEKSVVLMSKEGSLKEEDESSGVAG